MAFTVALVTPHTLSHRTAEETLSLGYLGNVLRESGYSAVIVDGWLRGINSAAIVEAIRAKVRPDVVCMSCYRSNLEQAKELLCAINQRFGHIPAICGGYGPTFHDADFLAAGFSVAVRGEAEHIIVPLVNALALGEDLSLIPGITYLNGSSLIRTKQTEPVTNLDLIPFPARDEIEFVAERKNPVHVCTSRGCRAHCSFCSIFAFSLNASPKNRWRCRSVQNITDELRSLYEKFGVTHIKFVDDSFLEPPRDEKWVAEFAETLERYNLPLRFRTQVRADRLNEAIVGGLKKAGWFSTSIGIENVSQSALNRMGKTASAEDNLRALDLLRRYGVYAQAGMILFDRDTTMDELRENCRFLLRYDWIVTKGIFTEMFAAEGTPYTKKFSKGDVLLVNQAQQNYSYEVRDNQARRVYWMLKTWHKSHSVLYDWVIDSITAPKVLPDGGYASVHALCRQLTDCDAKFFRRVMDHVAAFPAENDGNVVENAIAKHAPFYAGIWSNIQKIYDHYGLVYDGIPNPFLS
ncbi:MAG TPA: radical SAM protein [Candidatus Paceibacterota bacterium]|nr:radical SAM protein [Candidatus Paceibacterota bacterium]